MIAILNIRIPIFEEVTRMALVVPQEIEGTLGQFTRKVNLDIMSDCYDLTSGINENFVVPYWPITVEQWCKVIELYIEYINSLI